MTVETPSSRWIPVEEYASDAGCPPSELVSLILDGALPGQRFDLRWYVAGPLVTLERAEPAVFDRGLLRLHVCKLGRYVTAGRSELTISVDARGEDVPLALQKIDLAMKTPPGLPLELTIGSENLLVDSSLWVDLGAALTEFRELNDLPLLFLDEGADHDTH